VNPLQQLVRPDWLTESAWPWTIGALPTPAGDLALTDVGQGPVLLLVHTGMWSFVWRDLISELSPDYRCITVDAPGNGLSYRPGAAGTTLLAASAGVGAVIDSLDLQDITLVAHDLGGPAGFAAAASRPDRVAGLVAVNTFGWKPTGVAFRGMLALMGSAPMRSLDAVTAALPRATATRFGVGRHWSTQDRAVFLAGIDKDARRSIHRYFRDARRADTLLDSAGRGLRTALNRKPMLTVFGAWNDPLGFQPAWKELFPDLEQRLIPRGGHFPMCDDPAAVAGWIRNWHTEKISSQRGRAGSRPA